MTVYTYTRDGVMREMETLPPPSYADAIRKVKANPTRFSWLKLMNQSPHLYLRAARDGIDVSFAEKLGTARGHDRKTALRIGTAVHHFILGSPDRVELYEPQRRGATWEVFERDAIERGHVVLNQREYAYAGNMVTRLRQCEQACELLFAGTEVEKELHWTLRGRAIRSTPDAFALGPPSRVVDLKTTRDSSPAFMTKAIFSMLYHAQLECYSQAIEACFGARPAQAWIVAIDGENAPVCFEVEPSALQAGARLLSAWAETLSVCEASGHFPYPKVFRVPLPEYLDESVDMLELPPEEEEV